ncbi:hypothetical protein BKA62DRAFT_833837 [Auriculariales sp. MPI-PUGE-AT-0066]|nr:hypothetical protein BKA62DRAFT_833837 [Auriculariales sp. MPI-PUGE-AT-0066]
MRDHLLLQFIAPANDHHVFHPRCLMTDCPASFLPLSIHTPSSTTTDMTRFTFAFATLALLVVLLTATTVSADDSARRAPEAPSTGGRMRNPALTGETPEPGRKHPNELTDEQVAAYEADFQRKLAEKQAAKAAAAQA